jgi:hypothetical protein
VANCSLSPFLTWHSRLAPSGVVRSRSRRALPSSILARFPPDVVEVVKAVADAEVITVSERIRCGVTRALSA